VSKDLAGNSFNRRKKGGSGVRPKKRGEINREIYSVKRKGGKWEEEILREEEREITSEDQYNPLTSKRGKKKEREMLIARKGPPSPLERGGGSSFLPAGRGGKSLLNSSLSFRKREKGERETEKGERERKVFYPNLLHHRRGEGEKRYITFRGGGIVSDLFTPEGKEGE